MDREVAWSRPSRRRSLGWLAVATAALIAGGLVVVKMALPRADEALWYTVSAGTLEPTAMGTGQFASAKQRLVASRETATVGQLVRRSGERVAVGDVVLRLENPELGIELEDARRALTDARDAFAAERASLALDEIRARSILLEAQYEQEVKDADLKAYRALLEKGVVSRLQFERAQADARLAQSRVDSQVASGKASASLAQSRLAQAEARVIQQRERVERIEGRIQDLAVQAPESGVIKTVFVDLGSSVQPGNPLFSVGPESPDLVAIEFPQGYIESLRVGMPIEISYNGRIAKAELASISADLRDGYGSVEARPNGDWPTASIGMVVRATVRVDRIEDAKHIPVPVYGMDWSGRVEVLRKRGDIIDHVILDDVVELDGYLVFPTSIQAGDQVSFPSMPKRLAAG